MLTDHTEKKGKFLSNITAAVNALLNDGLSKKAAAKKFGISRSTLQFRLKNLNGKTSCGPATVLSEKEEELLQTWIIESFKKGFPRRKVDLQMSVKQFLDIDNRQTPLKNNMPGNGWSRAFMQRHLLISVRTSEHVTTASACVSEKDIKKWFSEIHQYL
ncbi:HTH CENPB-type domain-containing protein, partial [Aphis craccivora]